MSVMYIYSINKTIVKCVFYRLFLTVFLINCSLLISNAQDIHFSQFYNAPLVINPGNVGHFDGDYRFAAIYRSQWKSITVPYKTFSGSFDMNLNKLEDAPGYLSAGLMLFQDKAGDSDFGTMQAAINLGYNYYADADKKHLITLALQPAFDQRSINYSDLTFDTQYNGDIFDANLSTRENFANTKFNFFDINAGVGYLYGNPEELSIGGGVGIHHLNKAKQTFMNDNDIKLLPRLSFEINSSFKINERMFLQPALLFQNQQKFREINGGANFKINFSDNSPRKYALYLGGFYRAKDAAIARLGLDYNYLHLGFSYDINFSDLDRASNNRGGYELSLVYIIKTVKPLKIHPPCPVY